METKFNTMVEDLERLIDEIFSMRAKTDTDTNQMQQEVYKLTKMINDMESHLNSTLLSEKSTRKAQDTHLANEVDNLVKQIATLAN